MCTVTLIPIGANDFVLTSNRDEAPNRMTLLPDFYVFNNTKLLFPKDEVAGGSWIGVSEKKRVLCVLNGAFEAHQRKSDYRLSRGVVMKDLLTCENLEQMIEDYYLEGIEPFTFVIVDWNHNLSFFELVWDGNQKHFKNLALEPKMWSSSSLYSEPMKQERQLWFNDFKNQNDLNSESILKFHENTHKENAEYGIIMDRLFVKTTSITQVKKTNNEVIMQFENLLEKSKSLHHFNLSQIINE